MLFPRLHIHNFRRFLTLLAQFSGHQLKMNDMARSLKNKQEKGAVKPPFSVM